MSRTLHLTLATAVVAALVAAIPATTPTLAQQSQDSVATTRRDETVPFRLGAAQIGQMQRKLDELGFSPGRVDGVWGPETSAAVLRFQQKRSLRATGKLDDPTFQALGLATTTSPSPVDAAPTAPPQAATAPATSARVSSAPAGPAPPAATGGGTSTAPGTAPGGSAGAAAASGDSNQAVATTHANASQPAHGANSFTKAQAQERIAREGFQNVGDLSKDDTGVWRGGAAKNGQPVHVWVDYKGNVGQE